jgi:hypothetical protein
MKTRALLAAAGALALLAVLPTGTAHAAAPGDCANMHVCLYPEPGYGGEPCSWRGNDPDLLADCAWMNRGVPPRSVWNNDTSSNGTLGVALFRATDYTGGRITCVRHATGTALTGEMPRSLRWVGMPCPL